VDTAERRAVVVTTPSASGARTNGATLRAAEVVTVLEATGYTVTRSVAGDPLDVTPCDLGVAISYVCAGEIQALRRQARRVWLDAVDSWLLVDASGLRRGHPTYALRALRDAARLARMPAADLVTYISGADLANDRGTIRARRRLVLPSRTPAPNPEPAGDERRVVLAGDWGYPPNRDALRWFSSSVLPLLTAQAPNNGWSVHIYGGGAPATETGRVRILGYADAPQMLYRWGDVHAAPVRFGAGVKRKVLMPLLAGLPVVTTVAGAHGLRPNALLDVRSDAVGFADALAQRLRRPPEEAVISEEGFFDRDDADAVTTWLRA
jgi:glycosyltransferase involved in cell wall biosynthesis